MSDYPYSSRSKSSLQGGRTPLKVIQPPSSFIERVNKVISIQIFENSKKPYEKQLESERHTSPYILTRNEKFSGTYSKYSLKSKRKTHTKSRLRLELGTLKLQSIFKSHKKQNWDLLKPKNSFKDSTFSKMHSQDSSIRSIIEESFKKYLPRTQPTVLTKCEKCGHVGLNFYTESTKENFSPRFLDKVRQLLPSTCVKKSLSEVSTLPISDFYPNTFSISPFQDISRDSLSNFSPEFSGGCKVQIPKLNFTKALVPKSRYSEEVLKGSPVGKVNLANISDGIKKLNQIFMTRLNRGFDMIFLSRANLPEQSLTFDFTLEESKISNEPSTLTGTFGDQGRILEISEIKKKREDSLSFEYSEQLNRARDLKTACKILYTRLDKLFYRRKVRGFYSLVDIMY